MVRSVELNEKEYQFNIGMRVFATWLKKNNITANQLATGDIPMGLFEIAEIFAMGVRAVGKQKVSTNDVLDLCDLDNQAFTKISNEVTECITLVSERIGGEAEVTKTDDDEKE